MQHYQEYVNYMIRDYLDYANNPTEWDEKFPKDYSIQNCPCNTIPPRKLNVDVVEMVMRRLDLDNRMLIQEIFANRDTISDNVYQVAKRHNVNQDELWILLRRFTRDVAKERRLI